MTESDAAWLAAFRKDILPGIVTRAAEQRRGDAACYAIAQLATVHANGRLLYHEGRAWSKPEQQWQFHAWNTLKGEMVDFYLYDNLPHPDTVAIDHIPDDVLSVPASEVYDRYESKGEYLVEQVREKYHPDALRWFVLPPDELPVAPKTILEK